MVVPACNLATLSSGMNRWSPSTGILRPLSTIVHLICRAVMQRHDSFGVVIFPRHPPREATSRPPTMWLPHSTWEKRMPRGVEDDKSPSGQWRFAFNGAKPSSIPVVVSPKATIRLTPIVIGNPWGWVADRVKTAKSATLLGLGDFENHSSYSLCGRRRDTYI